MRRRRTGAEAIDRRRAMTLVEILAVVVILGLVAGTLLVGFSGSFGKAKHELAKTGIGLVVTQLEKYRLEHSAWPTNDQGLALITDGQAKPADPYYLNTGQLLDPWNRPYLYVLPGPDGHPYEVLTYGADGQPGGEAEDADISSVNLRGAEQ
jgi:general secretion pathway protein G